MSGWGSYDTIVITGEVNLITLDSVLAGRIATLVAQGKSEIEADTIAKWELLSAIGIDTLIRERPDISSKHIDYTLDYIFGGTTKSTFFKEVTETFFTIEKSSYTASVL